MLAGTARLGLATAIVALAMAVTSGMSAAQEGAKPSDAALAKGRDVFDNYACGTCHSLADAGATGHVGPAFDGNANLSQNFLVDRVANGQGGMPAFKDQLSAEEIAAVAAYILHAAKK